MPLSIACGTQFSPQFFFYHKNIYHICNVDQEREMAHFASI